MTKSVGASEVSEWKTRRKEENEDGILNTSQADLQRLPGSSKVSSTEKMADNFRAPNDPSEEEEDGNNGEDTMTQEEGEESERVQRGRRREPKQQVH